MSGSSSFNKNKLGDAGLNFEMLPQHLRQWDVLGDKWVVVQKDYNTIDKSKIPVGHTDYSWNNNGNVPIGHTNYSIGN